MDECIHGFEPGMCASCFPPPEPATPLPAKRRTTLKSTQLRTPTADKQGRVAAVKAPNLPQRVFHVTHVDNLPAILEAGELRPSTQVDPEVKLASPITDELRQTALAVDEVPVADCVAFSLSPQATWWLEVQQGAAGPTWSEDARRAKVTDFVVFGVPVEEVSASLIVTDGDAAAMVTRIGNTEESRQRMLARAAADASVMQAAEALVPGPVPLSSVAMVAVANDKRRDQLKKLLAAQGLSAKVVVYPPWFVPVEWE